MEKTSSQEKSKPSTLLPPYEDYGTDPAWIVDMEPGEEVDWLVKYMDGHTEEGRLRYTGKSVEAPTISGSWEKVRIPLMEAITHFTEGPVIILRWGK